MSGHSGRKGDYCPFRPGRVGFSIQAKNVAVERAERRIKVALQDFGLIGLAVMGQNLVLNIEEKGYSMAVFNRTAARTEEVPMVTGRAGFGVRFCLVC